MKTCYFCRGTVEPGVVDHMAHRGSKYVLIRGLKADVCGQCGEVYIDLDASRCVDAALTTIDRADERMTVAVLAAGKCASDLGFYTTGPAPRRQHAAKVAEDKAKYGTSKRKRA